MTQKICALVVTYNRPQLLTECLNSVINQSHPVSELIIVDNHSNMDTLMMLKDNKFIDEFDNTFIVNGGYLNKTLRNSGNSRIVIHCLRLDKNTGGAGGFYAGMKMFYEKTGCDQLWLMDDDSNPTRKALDTMIFAYRGLYSSVNLGYLCSQVYWRDGQPCNMASPKLCEYGGTKLYSLDLPVIKVQNSAFVSMLIHRQIIKVIGLPYKEFFIWSDDLEYTSRINKKYSSYVVLNSEVVHNTKHNLATSMDAINGDNYFKYQFGLRNEQFFLLRTNGLRALSFFFKKTVAIFFANLPLLKKLRLFYFLCNGFIFSPKIEYPSKQA